MDYNEIHGLLVELEAVLRKQGEANWIRGVIEARQVLERPDGLKKARASYAAMNKGAGSFDDYNIWHDDFDVRKKANAEIDRLRDRLWKAFDL